MLLREELGEAIEGEFACFAVEVELIFKRQRRHATTFFELCMPEPPLVSVSRALQRTRRRLARSEPAPCAAASHDLHPQRDVLDGLASAFGKIVSISPFSRVDAAAEVPMGAVRASPSGARRRWRTIAAAVLPSTRL